MLSLIRRQLTTKLYSHSVRTTVMPIRNAYQDVQNLLPENGPSYDDWKPGPYPTTPEARLAAAKKYNLHPSEYQPYPEDECCGDYPKLPFIYFGSRDPNYPWDNPTARLNHGEPIHKYYRAISIANDDLSTPLGFGYKPLESFWFVWYWFPTLLVFYILGFYFQLYPSMAPRQIPRPGKDYYTFELVDD